MLINEAETSELLYHAAELIRLNADELRVAFSCEDGGIPSADRDVEYQIADLVNTSRLLLELAPKNRE